MDGWMDGPREGQGKSDLTGFKESLNEFSSHDLNTLEAIILFVPLRKRDMDMCQKCPLPQGQRSYSTFTEVVVTFNE